MKVLLVQSPTGRREAPIYPLGLAFLSSHLRASGHEVKGLDLSLSSNCREDLREAVRGFAPGVVAVSLRNIDDSSWPVTWSYLGAFSDVMDELGGYRGKVIVGGPGFSIYAERILALWPRVDHGLIGEGELALPELVNSIAEGRPGPERLVTAPVPSMSSLMNPDYSLFPLSDYPGRGAIGVQSRRGCPFGCRYCTYGRISGRVFRNRPVQAVIQDVLQLEKLGARSFMFVDSVFDHPKEYAEDLVRAMALAGVAAEWGAWLSEGVSSGFLEDLRKSGCVWVDFSPDAITGKGLSLLGKPASGRSLFSLVRHARRAGLTVGVNFFNGNPGEGFAALMLKFLFMLRVRLCLGWRNTFVNIGTIRIYPGSPMAAELPDDTDLLPPVFMAPRGLSALVYRFFAGLKGRRRR